MRSLAILEISEYSVVLLYTKVPSIINYKY